MWSNVKSKKDALDWQTGRGRQMTTSGPVEDHTTGRGNYNSALFGLLPISFYFKPSFFQSTFLDSPGNYLSTSKSTFRMRFIVCKAIFWPIESSLKTAQI